MAAQWLRQYSQSDITRSPSFGRRTARISPQIGFETQDTTDNLGRGRAGSFAGSYNASERSYPDSVDPGEDEGLDGLLIAPRRPANSISVPSPSTGRLDSGHYREDSEPSDPTGLVDHYLERRRPSITFDPRVRLDNGIEQDLKSPLPALAIRTRSRGKSLLDEMSKARDTGRARSENDSQEYDPETGERLDEREERERQRRRSARFKANQPRWPLLQSTVDSLASEVQRDPDSELPQESLSLTSKATLSPSIEEVRTPVDETVMSPVNISSPSADWLPAVARDVPKPLSVRSKSYAIERNSSFSSRFARSSRRSTTQSNSASPASAFLSRYCPSSPVSQPDDEGQEIGDYVLGREIGFGGFSIIREAYTITGHERLVRAVKIVRKNVVGRGEQENDTLQAEFEHEIEIWRSLSHSYILPLFAVYNTMFATFAITQLNTGGTLFDAVRANRTGLSPRLIKRYGFHLAAAIRYLHEDMRIIHRDIKLENCLVDMSSPDSTETGGKILLCDFGLADYIPSSDTMTSRSVFKGTPDSGTGIDPRTPVTAIYNIRPADTSTNFAGSLPYAAPELLESGQAAVSVSVDMWAYGVVVYALTMGRLPFTHPFAPRLRMMILGEEWDKESLREKEEKAVVTLQDVPTEEPDWSYNTNPNPMGGLSELVERCMELDPDTRWNIQDVLCSQWLQEEVEQAGEEE